MAFFPMMINLDNRPVLVVGGGEEGLNKVKILYEFGAKITLISEDAYEEAATLASIFYKRSFEEGDLIGKQYDLVVASTDDRETNAHISRLARGQLIPINVVDDIELCTFIFPAIVKDKDVVCAVSSGGKSPYVAQYIKKLIGEIFPKGIGEINDRMGEYRIQVKKDIPQAEERRKYLKEKFDKLIDE